MTETEIRKQINQNMAQYGAANDATKALLMAKNEGLAAELDKLTGGQSVYDATTGRWNLSASTQDATDRYIEMRDLVAGSAYGGYNPKNDPTYSTLKKEYLREADRATEDTMGTFAGMTGGIPSTAAVTAAQQSGNYYRGQLADRQVELAAQDYDKYLAGLDADNAMLNLYASEAEASAANLAALGDFSAMGKLYGWTPEQIAEAQRLWALEQGGGGGGYRKASEPVRTTFPTYDNGMTDVKIANAAAKLFNTSKYGVNSAALDKWLASNGYSGNSASAFKAYYASMYDITGEKPNKNDEKQDPYSNVKNMYYV